MKEYLPVLKLHRNELKEFFIKTDSKLIKENILNIIYLFGGV